MKPFNNTKRNWMRSLGLACLGLAVFSGCREEINKDDLYTFTGETVCSFLEKNDSIYSKYVALLNVVRQSDRTQSTVSKLLASYGNYTCFAPTNEAIEEFLDSAYVQGKFNSKDFNVFLDSAKAEKHLGDSLAKVIVYNSIIDCGNNTAFETAVFPVDNGIFSLPNMNDRYLTANTATENGKMEYYILKDVKVIYKDIEVENGYIQGVNKVIAPSNSSVSDLFKNTKNMTMFATLLQKTGWEDSMGIDKYLDQDYEEFYKDLDLTSAIPEKIGTQSGSNALLPEHRKNGFTVFAETDDVFKKELELEDPSQLIEKLNEYLKKQYDFLGSQVTYGTSDEDLKKPDNAINQFVAYHLLPVSLASNQLVNHWNEKDFDREEAKKGNIIVTIPVYEYYETMSQKGGPRRLLKITESSNESGKRLNRKAIMDTKTYKESSVVIEGALINTQADAENTANSALNGYIYPIDRILVYNYDVVDKVLKERLRFDWASLLPELINLGYRRPMGLYSNDKSLIYFPPQFKLQNIQRTQFTVFTYLSGATATNWSDYQGDEVFVVGNYDLTLKLPPVPYDGTYEIRYAVSGNPERGMCQVYFGEEGTTLAPVDVPMDLRMPYASAGGKGGLATLNVGWELGSEDQSYNEEVAKNLRNSGWVRGPRYYTTPTSNSMAYDNAACNRKILTQQYMETGKTYYLRFKSALDNTQTEFFCDYIEMVPSEVYAHPTIPEDEW